MFVVGVGLSPYYHSCQHVFLKLVGLRLFCCAALTNPLTSKACCRWLGCWGVYIFRVWIRGVYDGNVRIDKVC